METLFRKAVCGGLLALAASIIFAADAPPGVHAGAWAGAAAAARSSAGASVKTAQTTAQQAALVSTQTVTVEAPAASSGGGGSSGGKTTTVRMVPDPYAPTMNATAPCRISVSGGVTVIGVGVSGGGSVEDDPCNLRETARLLSGIGQADAAARVMCNDPRAAAALGATVCPSSGAPKRSGIAATDAASSPHNQTAVDPICDQAARFGDPVLSVRNGCPGT